MSENSSRSEDITVDVEHEKDIIPAILEDKSLILNPYAYWFAFLCHIIVAIHNSSHEFIDVGSTDE